MTMRELLERRVELKRQHIFIIQREIFALEEELKNLREDPPPEKDTERDKGLESCRETGAEEQEAVAI